MKIFYLDHNIYIYALSDLSIMDAINICKGKKIRFAYSPAHIEETYKALVDNGDSYLSTTEKILESISKVTNNLEMLPSNGGIIFLREHPIDCYRRVFGIDTTDRIKADSKQRFQTDTSSYHALLAEDKHYQSISTVAPEKIWEIPIIANAISEVNQNMPITVRRYNLSPDMLFCATLGADKRLPADLQIEQNSFQRLKKSHTQLEYVIEILFRVLALCGYNADKSETTAISGTHDVSHAIYATEATKFFTTDKRFAQRCRAVYHFLGISTQVVVCKPDQIYLTLQSNM